MSEFNNAGVQFAFEEGIARLTLSNVKRHNAISWKMWNEVARITQKLVACAELRVVLIRGEGESAFASGADISEFGTSRRSANQAEAYNQTMQAALDGVAALPVPVVALIHGYCIGGGTALALECDLRYSDSNLRFGIPAAKLGIGYSPAWVKKLVDVVGPAPAAEILMTAEQYGPSKALEYNFVHQVCQPPELVSFVENKLDVLRSNAPLTLKAAKSSIHQAVAFDRCRNWSRALEAAKACAASEDYLTALEAFEKKHTPVFKGK